MYKNLLDRLAYNKAYYQKKSNEIKNKQKEYRRKNKEKVSENQKKYVAKYKKQITKKQSIYYKNNKEKLKKQSILYYLKNKDNILKYRKKHYQENKNKIKNDSKIYYYNNKKKIHLRNKEGQKKWCLLNKEKIAKNRRIRENKRRKNDIRFKVHKNISGGIRQKIKYHLGTKGGKATFSFLPYTVSDLIKHLEDRFKPGMTWKNYGKWHIDHKIADCKFNYKSVEDKEFQKCWALDNLQPLWAEENLKKGIN